MRSSLPYSAASFTCVRSEVWTRTLIVQPSRPPRQSARPMERWTHQATRDQTQVKSSCAATQDHGRFKLQKIATVAQTTSLYSECNKHSYDQKYRKSVRCFLVVKKCTSTFSESSSDWSQFSGSFDASNYLSPRMRRNHGLMSMKKTLALIHLALVWSQEPLTLSDLLR